MFKALRATGHRRRTRAAGKGLFNRSSFRISVTHKWNYSSNTKESIEGHPFPFDSPSNSHFPLPYRPFTQSAPLPHRPFKIRPHYRMKDEERWRKRKRGCKREKESENARWGGGEKEKEKKRRHDRRGVDRIVYFCTPGRLSFSFCSGPRASKKPLLWQRHCRTLLENCALWKRP